MPQQLFQSGQTLRSLLGDPRRWATAFVDSLSDAELQQESPEKLVERGLAEFGWMTIEVDLENVKRDLKQGKVNVSGDFRRGLSPGEFAEVDGHHVYVSFPFTGNTKLLDAPTGALMTGGVFADVQTGSDNQSGHVVVSVGLPFDISDDVAMQKVEQAIADVKRHLPRFLQVTNDQVLDARNVVRTTIDERINFRLRQTKRKSRLSEALGIDREVESTQTIAPASRPTANTNEGLPQSSARGKSVLRDFFICHASEDKPYVRRLVNALEQITAMVWFDDYEIQVGDSLRGKIEQGLKISTYGVVVVSPRLIAKKERGWIKRELGGLMARPEQGRPVILPVWYETSADDVANEFPSLADTAALSAHSMTVEDIANALWERKLFDER